MQDITLKESRAKKRTAQKDSPLIELYIIHDTHTVIPAQAGIQQDKNAFYQTHWIPACAGMTWRFYYFSNSILDDAALSSIM